jgi:hypothetical protein
MKIKDSDLERLINSCRLSKNAEDKIRKKLSENRCKLLYRLLRVKC